ncbi:MAG: extracellular solute-binding protein, partial [Chloroflexi bacterium]|nr:extracellular solute-binding protein [Chloroflexota bacterium]
PQTLEEIKEKLPNITVKVEEITNQPQVYQTCFVAGTCADIVYHDNMMSKYYDEGVILELTDYYERDGLDHDNDFYHGLGLTRWKGKLYGVPHMFETAVIFYNRDLVEKYWGKDLWEAFPDGNWELEDFTEVAQACTVDTDGDGKIDQWGAYFYHRSYYYGMEWFSWTVGDGIFDIENVKYNFTSDGPRRAAHYFLDAVKGPKPWIISQEDYSEVTKAAGVTFPFMAQKTAMRHRMCTDTGRIIGTVGPGDGSKGFRWDIFHSPNIDGKQAVTRAGGHPNNIAKSTKYPDEAWAICRELGTSIGQKWIGRTKMAVPCYRKDPTLRGELIVGVPKHDNVILDCVEQKGGYGDHLRFHNESEARQMFQKEMDLLYAMPYEQAKKELDNVLARLEEEMNKITDYGGEPKPYVGLQFPFRPGQVL